MDAAMAGRQERIASPAPSTMCNGARQAYYDKIAKFHMAPLWEVLKDLVTPEPKTQCGRRCGISTTSSS